MYRDNAQITKYIQNNLQSLTKLGRCSGLLLILISHFGTKHPFKKNKHMHDEHAVYAFGVDIWMQLKKMLHL